MTITTSLPLWSFLEDIRSFVFCLMKLLLRMNHWFTLRSVRPVCWATCIKVVSFGKKLLANAAFSTDVWWELCHVEQLFISPLAVNASSAKIHKWMFRYQFEFHNGHVHINLELYFQSPVPLLSLHLPHVQYSLASLGRWLDNDSSSIPVQEARCARSDMCRKLIDRRRRWT